MFRKKGGKKQLKNLFKNKLPSALARPGVDSLSRPLGLQYTALQKPCQSIQPRNALFLLQLEVMVSLKAVNCQKQLVLHFCLKKICSYVYTQTHSHNKGSSKTPLSDWTGLSCVKCLRSVSYLGSLKNIHMHAQT